MGAKFPLGGGGSGASASISPTSGPIGTVFTCNGPANATYQWYLNGSAISGATAKTYASTALGTLSCLALPAATVTVAAPTVTTAPTLSTSAPVVGSPVTPTPGVYSGAPSITAVWTYGDTGAAISGAPTTSGTPYTPGNSDLGHTLHYAETATNAGGSVTSAAPTTAAVIAQSGGTLDFSQPGNADLLDDL